jgi:outer membrane protein OmpA-like peptidoglycan-associated protein
MKILIIGFLVFFSWSAVSTRLYVCNIKGLCGETGIVQISDSNLKDSTAVDHLGKSLAPDVALVPGNMIIYFAFDKSEFKSDVLTDKYFSEANSYLNKNPQARLSVTGHTDSVGSDNYNQDLGFRRAQRIKLYFEGRGMPADKILIGSKGEKDPASDNSTESGRSKNRRASIIINK